MKSAPGNLLNYARIAPVFALLLLTLAIPTAHAWGCKGHQTVALIAEKHLTPEAKQFVDKLLSENPADPKVRNYCGDSIRDAMASASTWADDVRNDRKNGPWHYIDIPRGAEHAPLEKFCGGAGCVSQALDEQLAILQDVHAEPAKRADALRYVIHFVGDLHQPLHATSNDDEGGNCVPLKYLRRKPREHNHSYTPNLHSIWDSAIVERDMEGADSIEYAGTLEEAFQSDIAKWQKEPISIATWVWESHDLAENTVYGNLTPKIAIEKPLPVQACTDDNNIGQRMLAAHIVAGETYQEQAAPAVERRIAQAGIRLALLLNAAVAPKP